MKFNIEDYKGDYVMHCKTEEEAKDFCNYLHSVGRKWSSGDLYTTTTYWMEYGGDRVYYFNDGTHGGKRYVPDFYTILEWSDFMNNEFTKADLKTGDVIQRRNGKVEIVFLPHQATICQDHGWNDLNLCQGDLTDKNNKAWDIVAVRRPERTGHCQFDTFELMLGTLVYERKEVEEMTLAEVCKLLGKEIKIVK